MAIICGVEEAGRGPVIGPMVMAAVTMDEKNIHKLENLGVKDSKLLTPLQRENMFEKIKSIVKSHEILILFPEKVDDALTSDDLNLNWLEAITSAELIDKLKPDKAILDCPSNNVKAYKEYVINKLKHKAEIIAEHKADLNYPIVGAASILAKVTRDAEVKKLRDEIGIDFGSGYPSDPKTIKFLKENWNKYPHIFRKTWASYKKVAESKDQKALDEF